MDRTTWMATAARRTRTSGALLATLCLAVTGCSGSRTATTQSMAGALDAQSREARGGGGGDYAQVLQQAARQLIRRGDITIEVADPATTVRRVEALAQAMGGHVASSRVAARPSSLVGGDAHVTLRVPADSLDRAMDAIAALGDVRRRGTSVTDVTEQVVDLDARRATLVASRDRLRALLARSDAVRDVVEVERELTRVQAELDSLDRRLTTLRSQVALSDLVVTLEQKRVLGPIGALFAGLGKVVSKLFVWS